MDTEQFVVSGAMLYSPNIIIYERKEAVSIHKGAYSFFVL